MNPTPDEIRAAAAQSAAAGIASAQGDQGSVTAMDPVKQLETADKIEAQQALKSGRSAWGSRGARAVPPGPV